MSYDRDAYLRRQYGWLPGTFENIAAAQTGLCYDCGAEPERLVTQKREVEIRLVCSTCKINRDRPENYRSKRPLRVQAEPWVEF